MEREEGRLVLDGLERGDERQGERSVCVGRMWRSRDGGRMWRWKEVEDVSLLFLCFLLRKWFTYLSSQITYGERKRGGCY